MKNGGITTIRVSVEAKGYYVGDHVKIGRKHYKIIDVKPTVLTVKPWRWEHYAYYFSKWWILGQIDDIKDFWGRVQCAKGNHKWEFYCARFENKDVYYLRVKECERCKVQYLETSIDQWTRRGLMFRPEEFRNLKMAERFEDID